MAWHTSDDFLHYPGQAYGMMMIKHNEMGQESYLFLFLDMLWTGEKNAKSTNWFLAMSWFSLSSGAWFQGDGWCFACIYFSESSEINSTSCPEASYW